MSLVILDAMEKENGISDLLERVLKEGREKVSHFKLKDMNILHCRACEGCAFKSPGKCIFNDDMHHILRALARCSTIIILTPIKFGGYPSRLKKAIDKIALLALPSYIVKDGRLLHPSRYGFKTLVGIGVTEKEVPGQEESFKRLVENNAVNLQYACKTLVLKASEDRLKIEQELEKLMGNVIKPRSVDQNGIVSCNKIQEVQQ